MASVDVAHKRRGDAVAEHGADAVGVVDGMASGGQDHVLELVGPRFAVLRGDSEAVAVGVVGATPVPEGAGEYDDRTGGHGDLDEVGSVGVGRLVLGYRAQIVTGPDIRRAAL